MTRRFPLGLVAVLLAAATILSGRKVVAGEARIVRDIEYASVDGHSLQLDLYLPAADDAPLVVFIHGGGWKGGSRDRCFVSWLKEHGYAVASISYRLSQQAVFPAQIHDCKAAVRWLRAHAADYGFSTQRIAVAGTSAGGHLATLLGVTGGVTALEGSVGKHTDQSSRVDAVVDYYGPMDFIQRTTSQPHKTIAEGSPVRMLLGGPANELVEQARLASPAFHVTADDAPLLIFHGAKDRTVLMAQSERIIAEYEQRGLPVSLTVLPDSGHGGQEFFEGDYRAQLLSFLNRQLRTHSLPRATPESQGISSIAIRDFVQAADDQVKSMHSFMLVRHGKVVAEGWWAPHAAERPHVLWSLSKSFTSTAVGLAVAEGKLSIDDRVLKFFRDDVPENPSENLRAMRVRDLLTMSAGHEQEPWWSGDEVWTERFLREPVVNVPGTAFRYNTPATYMQSAIVQKVTGQTVRDYLQPRIFDPLGIERPTWDQSPQGISIGGYGLYLKTEDIAKFGQLYLQGGEWQGRQLLPEGWIAQATSKQVDNDKAPSAGNPDWRQGYGFQFWRCRHGAFRGDGKDGQFCIVMPEQDAVIAITAETGNMQRQLDLVWEHLLPAFQQDALPEAPDAVEQLRDTLTGLKLPNPMVQTPAHVGPPQLPRHATGNRGFQGIPSMAVAPGGRLWANWYAGVTPGEDQNNYVVLSTSGDGGRNWQEVMVIDPDGPGSLRAFDPELWQAPTGRLFVFWTQAEGHNGTVAGVWSMHTDTPDSPAPDWSQPRRMTDGVMMCKPTVLRDGTWAMPASTWRATDSSARMLTSNNLGRSWSLLGGCNVPADVRAFDEHMIVERNDGALWLLARTKYGIGQSISMDRGRTWPDLEPSEIAHTSARFFIRRLQSGNLLLVKHGAISTRTGRSHLTAFVSADDGATWSDGLLLDERGGVSYPDGQQTSDGLIRIIYDYNRQTDRHILMAAFREEDAVAGGDVSGHVRLRQLVSDADGGQQVSDR
jgi:CubicO group peptidase (beta-lactamase class C family)/pimeloyl-ACP methyl ester carboxylesterase